MAWKAFKLVGIVCAGLLTVVFVVLLVLVTRPVLLTGVSGYDLAHSVAGATSASEGGNCRKLPDSRWRCSVTGPDANGSYLVKVNWMGCWTATPTGPPKPEVTTRHTGCIELGDVVTLY